MNEATLFLMFILIFAIPFILGTMSKWNECEQKVSVPYKDYKITIEPIIVVPNVSKGFTNEAKDILVTLGFTATEAKKLISEVGPHNSVDELVQAALMKVKI